jgi:ribosome maturation factor RimP
MSRQLAVARVEELARALGQKENVEIVEVELKGSGRNQLLRVFIDKPDGVTHSDCEHISRSLSELLDGAALFLGEYTLEVSSPGIERKLKKREDYERFRGQKARIVVRHSEVGTLGKSRFVEGTLAGVENDEVLLDVTARPEIAGSGRIRIPLTSIDRANLKFEW